MMKRTVQMASVTLAQGAADAHSPTFHDMRIFLIVAQEGSFSAAARLLGLSPASVSRHMNALEDRLQVRLLNRSTRTLTLTEAGQLFSTKVESILGDIGQLCEQLRDANAKPQGVLRVNSRVLVGHEHICQLLPDFNQKYPDIRVDLSLSNETIDLVGNYIDVDIRIGQLPDSSLIAKKLIRSERWLCATPQYLAEQGNLPQNPADLTRFRCLTYRPGLEPVIWRFRTLNGQVEEISIDGFLQTNSGTGLKISTLGGLGISLMPDWSVAREIQTGQLVRLLPDHEISFTSFENGIHAVYPAGRHLSMRSRVFIDYLTDYFRGLRHELKIDQ
jgi:DNA-binding transcriptional LysR family regulator